MTDRPQPGKRITIRDVAKSAGVSYQTVSRALNDKGEIDTSTKQRVLDTARRLGYRPSRFARGLVRQDSTSVGLVIPNLLNPYFTEVAAGALAAARRRDWHVVVYDTAEDEEQELSTLAVLGSQVDAVVGYFSQPGPVIDQYTSGMPVVQIGRTDVAGRFGEIRVDGEQGVHAAIAHLAASGRRRIGMLDHDHHGEASVRYSWYADAMREHGLPTFVTPAAQSIEGGQRAMAAMLEKHPDLDAIFTYNDVIAIGAMFQARLLGRRVPADFAVIGFDGLAIGTMVEPPLSSVRIDTRRVGAIAIDQVGQLLDGVKPEVATVRATFLLRGSA
ncbi:LacI family DNA-binding transcriptional regulator [Kibdelosporangium persicum]|uniref:HTH-type transcriptional regulator DegA n=1 Tax=Kibdelosporangium persicum TaxID=2698649 RepID=A0ABX2FCE5_9PSEU|nr:LacI family DNA-binding transcriptional regulator [Kibdelosporangium persicum]NRN68962.1 HTH-type transcriptional regulator DegA [Kibdelosporangium persicum]